MLPSGETYTGAAWLSSARVVRCGSESFNDIIFALNQNIHSGKDDRAEEV